MARSWPPPPRAGVGWVQVRSLRQPRTPEVNQLAILHTSPALQQPLLRSPMIGRRLPAANSFVLAAARLRALQLGPRPAGIPSGHAGSLSDSQEECVTRQC